VQRSAQTGHIIHKDNSGKYRNVENDTGVTDTSNYKALILKLYVKDYHGHFVIVFALPNIFVPFYHDQLFSFGSKIANDCIFSLSNGLKSTGVGTECVPSKILHSRLLFCYKFLQRSLSQFILF